ncbi:RNA helicase [Aphelenchoides fujianensis]|nr:RNA helicase [Aphelenchoides fujianensis]
MSSFKAIGVNEWLAAQLRQVGVERPTPVQAACIPQVLAGRRCAGLREDGHRQDDRLRRPHPPEGTPGGGSVRHLRAGGGADARARLPDRRAVRRPRPPRQPARGDRHRRPAAHLPGAPTLRARRRFL